MSLKVAKTWTKVYIAFEVTWFILWVGSMVAYLSALGEEGSFYRIFGSINAFHFMLAPCVEYTLQDGYKRILLGFLAVVATDTFVLWEIAGHTPEIAKEVGWAFGLSIGVTGFALFVTTFIALPWFIYVWYHGLKFRIKGTTEEKPEMAGAQFRFRIK